MSQIFDNNETIQEAKDKYEEEDEDEDEGDEEGEEEGDEDDSEDEDESEESDSEPTSGGQNKTQGGVARGAQSLQMKPSSASPEMGGASGGQGDSSANRDANGGGTVNPDGKGFQTTTPTVDSSEAMRSS